MSSTTSLRIAVIGCCHGSLNAIYASVTTSLIAAQKQKNIISSSSSSSSSSPSSGEGPSDPSSSNSSIDLLIICGDFQAIRNSQDLNGMSVPIKYRNLGDFHEYYSGKRVAPYLTVFIGGNHEASNYAQELFYGGWVAERIYYLGAANVLRFGGLRLAGLSGIWKGYDYRRPHFERLPFGEGEEKSVYHVRELDVRKLLLLRTQVDIGLSHDWPEGIQWVGDSRKLFRDKPFLEGDARSGRLGNVAARYVLERLRPRYWFSAHLHVRFAAVVKHGHGMEMNGLATSEHITNGATQQTGNNPDEIGLDLDEPKAVAVEHKISLAGGAANSDEISLDLDDLEVDETDTVGLPDRPTTNPEAIDLDSDDEGAVPLVSESPANLDINPGLDGAEHTLPENPASTTVAEQSSIPEDLRNQLPDAFKTPIPAKKLPFPEDIKNKETKFLALDKCLPNRHFLQLLEIPTTTGSDDEIKQKPFKLEYDQEWLAVTRVFAKDLVIGNSHAQVPRDQGEAVYRRRIEEEEAWIAANLVATGKMVIPENFVPIAPIYDPAIPIQTRIRPTEHSNPQTQQFCDLLQIANPLAMSDEERTRREAETAQLNANPIPSNSGYRGHSGRGRGGRGGRGHGRGRGR